MPLNKKGHSKPESEKKRGGEILCGILTLLELGKENISNYNLTSFSFIDEVHCFYWHEIESFYVVPQALGLFNLFSNVDEDSI